MSTVRLIFGLMLYVFFISTLIAYVSLNMGYMNISPVSVDYTPPTPTSINATANWWDSIPFVGEAASAVGGIIDTAGMLGSVMGSVLGIILWTLPESIFPDPTISLIFNVVFIKIPLVALIWAILDVVLP